MRLVLAFGGLLLTRPGPHRYPAHHYCPANAYGDAGNLLIDGKLSGFLSCRDLNLPLLEGRAKGVNNG
jgi:hypothetical protein